MSGERGPASTPQSWEDFTDSCLAEVDIYKDLIDRANDIYYSRVEKLLDSITSVQVTLFHIYFPLSALRVAHFRPMDHGAVTSFMLNLLTSSAGSWKK